MQPRELLPIATGAADSEDFTITAIWNIGQVVSMKDADGSVTGGCQIDVFIKDDAGNYHKVGTLRRDPRLRSMRLLDGVYRLSRTADSAACGAFIGICG
jgi:hypothetical protein